MKTYKKYDDIPKKIRNEIDKELTKDILERFDNSTYHNTDIIFNVLAEHNCKLADEYN